MTAGPCESSLSKVGRRLKSRLGACGREVRPEPDRGSFPQAARNRHTVLLLAFAPLDGGGELRDDDVEIGDDAQVAELEDRRVFVLVDGDDQAGGAHAGLVLNS